MKLTIAIPTHNRAGSLRETLESLTRLRPVEEVEIECLVVDNHSTDDTASVVEAFADGKRLAIRRVFETRLGSSFARNRAFDEMQGDLIFFIDDDVIVEPDWAFELLGEMERRALDACCGAVLARWPSPPPSWLGPQLYVKLAVHQPAALESAAGAMEHHSNYFSANVGLRRSCVERFGRFREDLGVVGGNPMSGEDTELFERIMANGGRMGFAPRAVVHHMIGSERLTRGYFRRKALAFGMGSAFKGGGSHNRIDKLARNGIRMALAAMRGDRPQAFYHELECINFIGYWRGRMMLRKAAKRNC